MLLDRLPEGLVVGEDGGPRHYIPGGRDGKGHGRELTRAHF